MFKNKGRLFLLFILVISAFTSQGQDSKGFDYGSVGNSLYTNTYFNLSIEIPNDWHIQSKEQNDRIADLGRELVAGEDETIRAVIDASKINTANLLTAFKYELGSATEYNPSIAIVAENINGKPGIKSGKDYLFHSRRFLMNSNFKFDSISENFEKTTINNIEFYRMDTYKKYYGLEIFQSYYSTIIKGFSFNIIMSYTNNQDKEILLKAIKSTKFI